MEITFKPNLAKEITTTIVFGIPFLLLLVGAMIAIQFVDTVPNLISLVFIPIIMITIWGFITSYGRVKNTVYKVNHKFITRKTKFISEFQEDIPVKQITNIDYSIGWFFDKMFKTGTISIYTAGSSFADIVISDVKDVAEIYENMNDILKLKKSVKINEDGETYNLNNQESELIKRIKPDAFSVVMQTAIIPAGAMIVFTFGVGFIFLPFFAISGFITYKAYKKRYYDFYNDKLEYYDGFFTFNKKTVPMERITNISENQTLFDRILGTYTINVQTAGSSGAEVAITFIKNGSEIAQDLKEVLKKHGRN